MRALSLWTTYIHLLVFITSYMGFWLPVQALTITTPQLRINALAQDDVLFSTQYWFQGTPTIHWRFMSLWRNQDIAVWQPDVYENISEPYKDRLYTYYNGSIMLLDVGVKDSGFYVMTVTEPSGISKDSIIILKVFEKLYEDLPFLIVFGMVLASIAGLFMILMWFLDKTVHLVKRRRKQRELEEVELQPLGSEVPQGPSH
ncbi:V-set and transmembrane domain-containing protein 5 [Amia ocellicauda]|uniref:V-set and transmembrane domain-containing protein 5 n=1 Tax=Amia ocellicauda TaxID=2972642 RepID=UPI003463F708